MNSLSVSALFLVVLCCIHGSNQEPAIESFTVAKATVAGEVQGAKQCGGPAEFKQFRIQGCDASAPCKVKAVTDKMVDELDFIPVIDMTSMRLKVTASVYKMAPQVVYDQTVKGLTVQKGVLHTVTIIGTSGEGVSGLVHYQMELFNADDDSLRACVECDVHWV